MALYYLIVAALVELLFVKFFHIMPPVVPANNFLRRMTTECCICLDDGTDTTLPACGHRFHRDCIVEWAQHSRSCPVCRRCMVYKIMSI